MPLTIQIQKIITKLAYFHKTKTKSCSECCSLLPIISHSFNHVDWHPSKFNFSQSSTLKYHSDFYHSISSKLFTFIMFPHLLMNTQVKSFHNLFGFTKYLLHKIRCFWTLYSINKKQHFWSEYFFEFKFIFCYYGSIFLKDIKIKTA